MLFRLFILFGTKERVPTYDKWVYHGETIAHDMNTNDDQPDESQNIDSIDHHHYSDEDEFEKLMEDVYRGRFIVNASDEEIFESREHTRFEKMLDLLEHDLYPGCKYSILSFVIKLLHLKVLNHWTNKSMDMLLELIKDVLPDGTNLPKSYYEAKTMLREIGLGYETVHACKYDCALFWKENKDLEKCPVCQESRWKINDGKGKKIPHKILRYFPIKPRLQRLYMSKKIAKDMRWHKEKLVTVEGELRHPADSIAWKEFDRMYEWFSNDPRNVRLGLATDGFNPFGNMSSSYSMWPVVLTPYNLPPWMCMKEPFFIMALLIPGPKAPGNDIDVYLRPLVDDLIDLWKDGVQTYDAYTNSNFKMHASVSWTINDFPAYANLSGWSTKGYMACPTCNVETHSTKLRSKISYQGHRAFLGHTHRWRKSLDFNGQEEHRRQPKKKSGRECLQHLELIDFGSFGKHPDNVRKNRERKRKRTDLRSKSNWTKKSILFELPYWQDLVIRHKLDVMHIEKNIADNIVGTLLKIEGKNKDTHKARQDLEDMNIRSELHLKPRGEKFEKPQSAFCFSKKEKDTFLSFIQSVKFPDGYASNISRCVNANDSSMSGYKSHDCHVLLQRLIPAGVRGNLNEDVAIALTELGEYFKKLCSRTLKVDVLRKMENDIVIILCKLERIYPPAFFDICLHLAVHLALEAIYTGPVCYSWMYPIKRYLCTLKKYVRNKTHPEGSIAEGYIADECLTFCSLYLPQGDQSKFNRKERNPDGEVREGALSVFAQNVKPLGGFDFDIEDYDFIQTLHWYVLNNCEEVQPYIEEYLEEIKGCGQIDVVLDRKFAKWFKRKIHDLRKTDDYAVSDQLFALACGPDLRVWKYKACVVNGVRFLVKDRDDHKRSQNSGISCEGEHDGKAIEFYGLLDGILKIEYGKGYNVFIFSCEWFDLSSRKTGIRKDTHFTSVNTSGRWYKSDPYILASQAKQVFYVDDLKFGAPWKLVQRFTHRHIFDVLENEADTSEDTTSNDFFNNDDESLDINIIIEDREIGPMHRVDVEPDLINRNDLKQQSGKTRKKYTKNNNDKEINETDIDGENLEEDEFEEEEDTEEEDDTLANYLSEEEGSEEVNEEDDDGN